MGRLYLWLCWFAGVPSLGRLMRPESETAMNTILKVNGVFVAIYIGVSILMALIDTYVVDLSAGGVIAIIMSALVSGQFFYRFEKRVPTSSESWLYSVSFIICVAVLTTVQLSVLNLPSDFIVTLGSSLMVKFLAFYAVVSLLACRFMFPKSAKGMLLAEEKKAGRG